MDRVFVAIIVLLSCQLQSLRCDDGFIDEAYDGFTVTGGPSSETDTPGQDSMTGFSQQTTPHSSSQEINKMTTSNSMGIESSISQVTLEKKTKAASVSNQQTVTVPNNHIPDGSVPSASVSINPLAAIAGLLMQSPQAKNILGLIFGQNNIGKLEELFRNVTSSTEVAELFGNLTSSGQGGPSREGLSKLLNNPSVQAVMEQVFLQVQNMLKSFVPNISPSLDNITPAQLFQAVSDMINGSGTGGNSSTGAIMQAVMSALPSVSGSLSAVLKNFGVNVNATDVMEQISELVPVFREQGNVTALQELAANATGPVGMLLDVLPLAINLGQMMKPEMVSNENLCLADFSAFVQSLPSKQMWALRMLDASGKPGTSILQGAVQFIGNYDECREISVTLNTTVPRVVHGEYWELTFAYPKSLGKLMVVPMLVGIPGIGWGFCLPRSCNVSSVTHAVSMVPLEWFGTELISASSRTTDDWKEDASAIAAMVILVLIASLSVIGTCYDVVSGWLALRKANRDDEEEFVDGFKESKAFVSEDGNRIWRLSNGISMVAMNGRRVYPMDEDGDQMTTVMGGGDGGHLQEEDSDDEERPHTSNTAYNDSFGRQLLLAFSITRNAEKILSSASGEGNLGCIHGIRVLSMAWVILGHSLSMSTLTTTENLIDFSTRVKDFTMEAVLNGTLSVDTFFLLSGCLVCYLFLRESKKTITGRPTVKQMVLYYVHRYWRLTPVYMIVVMAYTGFMRHLAEGPLSNADSLKDAENCRSNWWTNLLYINNIYKNDEMCLGSSWFLANDMQFHVVAPLALLPIAFGLEALGIIVMFAFLVIHISTYGYFEYHLKGATLSVHQADFFQYIYFVPWCRVGVFGIGLFLGYVLHKTKCKVKLPRFVLVLGWQLALAIGLMCTYFPYDDWKDGIPDWDLNTTIIYTTLSRPGWAVFVSWIIFVCCTGNGGVVNRLLSWGAWMPLGRLTYGAYLLHPIILSYTMLTLRKLVYANLVEMSYHFIGTFVVSYGMAFILCVLVESPCVGLEKAVLTKMKLKRS
ncbi:nose resistant to fluoxetine protein 6-like [Haliotis rubra]|uniref:nose resistant to fluoxetine protein 6-like n=1 Tax=Haliotis rubra TaxID=36100 RepID=UPI001EE51BBE|nr:nose resistant to fluoxetine protein 6-like [Haliotis rubra]